MIKTRLHIPIAVISFLIFLACGFDGVAQIVKDCSTCASQILKKEQIKGLSIDELRFLTNDLFARRGYKFEAGDINSYYGEKSWYKQGKDNKSIVFNDVEKQNIQLFQEETMVRKTERKNLIGLLKNLQQSVVRGNRQELKQQFGYTSTVEGSEFTYLQKAMKKLDIDDLNWFKHLGMYTLTIDNGDLVTSYEIKIKGNDIEITYNQQGGSHLADGASLYPNDYGAPEFAHFWRFKFDGQLRFVKWDMAG